MTALPVEQITEKLVTIEEITRMASQHPDVHLEVVEGEIVEKMGAGTLHHIIIKLIMNILDSFVIPRDLGIVLPDGLLYMLHKQGRGIKGARVADVSFIRKENFPKGWNLDEPFPGAPDLAIEVMSPTDTTEETLQRVKDYLNAGTEQVWVFFPKLKEVQQFRRDKPDTIRVYRNDELMEIETLFPGLEIRVSAFFVLPSWMTADGENQPGEKPDS